MRSGSDKNTTDIEQQSHGRINVCRFYASGKFCKFGKKCHFVHQRTDDGILNLVKEAVPSRPNGSVSNNSEAQSSQSESPEHDHAGDIEPVICKFFLAHGPCRYGRSCKFSHAVDYEQYAQAEEKQRRAQHAQKLCHFFQQGYCRSGNRCSFKHAYPPWPPAPKPRPSSAKKLASSASNPASPKRKALPNINSIQLSVDDLTDEVIQDLRNREIEQLRRRYPLAQTQEAEDGSGDIFSFTFIPSDPDWPYDVKDVDLIVRFPVFYPKCRLKVSVVDTDKIPQVVRKEVADQIRIWLRERRVQSQKSKRVELVFRALLRWLDRKLEEIFTNGLKKYRRQLEAEAARVQFVSASELRNTSKEDVDSDDEYEEENECNDEPETEHLGEPENEVPGNSDESSVKEFEVVITGEEQEETSEQKEEGIKSGDMISLDTPRKGTEVKLQNLQLGENVACMFAQVVGLIIQCSRCKNKTDVKLKNNKLCSIECAQCHTIQVARWRGALVHSMSSILGYLDLTDCVAFDMLLLDIGYTLTCLECNHESTLEGLTSDQPKNTWCRHCHKKLMVAMQSVRFLQLQPAEISKDKPEVLQVGKIKKVRDPVIQVGNPLPDFGTCKHYKKSYRWLRFPCCGKAYPCDVCHDEKELDHEMKYANRMICGHCAKEQPYSGQGLCISCQSSMTKRITSHWEGGKGCRDKIRMARTDNKKFNSMNKTVSRKSQPQPKKAAAK